MDIEYPFKNLEYFETDYERKTVKAFMAVMKDSLSL